MGQRPNDLRPWESPNALFGSELRRYREAAGLSLAALCEMIRDQAPYAKSTIGGIERGETRPDRILAIQADRVLDTREALVHLWDGLYKGTNVVPAWFTDWAIQEPEFNAIRSYQPLVIPGLLQTPAYAAHLLDNDEAAVEARIARQDVLTRDTPPDLMYVMDESVLHRGTGSPDLMQEQLQRLITASSRRVRIQVVPLCLHEGTRGAFAIGTLPDGSEVGYKDNAISGDTTTDRLEVTRLTKLFTSIQSAAYPVSQSLELIAKVTTEKWT
ncbi:Scr1 family TA system antitoxin-like transcriptional regulator [Actinomadura syzygii]|uniref:Helix-turn-helix domain-containing protein n=1 Tax=Actinomadura syzygii TaxID=1427538 RepID=A0A5D0U4I7_9ACTN|nr:helix-turn-helix transcriptional regulator [Actinomadura syzygii]TYC13308.1 helix-turn-helix domain-containing protein [Actinomadura syzygii]